MPKKRTLSHFSKPPTSVHPSISSHNHQYDSQRDAEPDKSVNDLLQQLRIDQAPSSAASPEARSDVNPQTVHPSLKHILQIPDTPPPRPRPGSRAMATHGRRRPPGPPAPRSWLFNSVEAPVRAVQKHSSNPQQRPSLETLGAFPSVQLPRTKSLQHQALMLIAKNWEFHVHYDQYYLPLLPTRYKQLLLTYIAAYSPSGITAPGLSLLLANDDTISGATGVEGLTHLDLSVSIGRSISLKDLRHVITTTFPTPSTTSTDDTTPESWDISTSLSPTFTTNTLTHLSLAHPPPSISWRHLLQLSPHLNTLTHLSLSHWPAPTLTPNSTTAYLSTPSGEISYGDHNLYSASLDNDFSGPANVLRLLSRDTYCLQHVDLSGCSHWLGALGWRDARHENSMGIDWQGPWSGLSTVVVTQTNRLPPCLESPTANPSWKTILKYRGGGDRDNHNHNDNDGKDNDNPAMLKRKRELMAWIRTEKTQNCVLSQIRQWRLWVFGWRKSPRTTTTTANNTTTHHHNDVSWEKSAAAVETFDDDNNDDGEHVSHPRISRRMVKSPRPIRFETGWDGWWIEDCIRNHLAWESGTAVGMR
ncbi:MAG: hypothetical protein Q9169_002325 [Polycauliona sp. 2 TL-2023]